MGCSLRPIGRAAKRLPPGNGGESRNPAKRGKMPSLAFFPTSFLTKTCLFFMLPDDAPRWKLRCVNPWGYLFKREKYQGGLTGHGVPGTVLRWHSVREKILNITGFLFFCLMSLWKNPGVRIPVLP